MIIQSHLKTQACTCFLSPCEEHESTKLLLWHCLTLSLLGKMALPCGHALGEWKVSGGIIGWDEVLIVSPWVLSFNAVGSCGSLKLCCYNPSFLAYFISHFWIPSPSQG